MAQVKAERYNRTKTSTLDFRVPPANPAQGVLSLPEGGRTQKPPLSFRAFHPIAAFDKQTNAAYIMAYLET
jgi:hypothetical protein